MTGDALGRVMATRVLATGTFDLLRVGHIHYLARAKALADELVVCVVTDRSLLQIKQRQHILPEYVRLEMVLALKVVDRAVLGSKADLLDTVRNERPDIIALGPTQAWKADWLQRELSMRGLAMAIVPVKEAQNVFPSSTSAIVECVVSSRGPPHIKA